MYNTALKLKINNAKEKCLRFLAVREHFGIFGNCLKFHSIAKKISPLYLQEQLANNAGNLQVN